MICHQFVEIRLFPVLTRKGKNNAGKMRIIICMFSPILNKAKLWLIFKLAWLILEQERIAERIWWSRFTDQNATESIINRINHYFLVSSLPCYTSRDIAFPLTVWAFSYEKQEYNKLHDFIKNQDITMSCCSGFQKVRNLFAQNRDPFESEFIGRRGEKKKVGTKGANITNEIVELLVFKPLPAKDLYYLFRPNSCGSNFFPFI